MREKLKLKNNLIDVDVNEVTSRGYEFHDFIHKTQEEETEFLAKLDLPMDEYLQWIKNRHQVSNANLMKNIKSFECKSKEDIKALALINQIVQITNQSVAIFTKLANNTVKKGL
jgi:hypothetical protein